MKISNAREYLVEKNIPHAVKDSILKFIEVKAIQTSLFNEKELLSCLPQRLSSELFLLHRTKVLQRIPIFDHISNKSVALHIFNLLHVSYFDKFEYVFKEGIACPNRFSTHYNPFVIDALRCRRVCE